MPIMCVKRVFVETLNFFNVQKNKYNSNSTSNVYFKTSTVTIIYENNSFCITDIFLRLVFGYCFGMISIFSFHARPIPPALLYHSFPVFPVSWFSHTHLLINPPVYTVYWFTSLCTLPVFMLCHLSRNIPDLFILYLPVFQPPGYFWTLPFACSLELVYLVFLPTSY